MATIFRTQSSSTFLSRLFIQIAKQLTEKRCVFVVRENASYQ